MNGGKMDRSAIPRFAEVMARVESLGARVALDPNSCLLTVKAPVEAEILEQMASCIPEVRHLLEGRMIAARAKELVGQEILFADGGDRPRKGTLNGAEVSGQMIVSVANPIFPERRPLSLTARADNLLVTFSEREADPAFQRPIVKQSKLVKQSKVDDLVERAGSLGIRLALDFCLLTATSTATWTGKGKSEALLEELANHVAEIRRLLKERMAATHAKKMAGQTILLFQSDAYSPRVLEGKLEGTDPNTSQVTASVYDRVEGRWISVRAGTENLIVLL